MPDEGELVVRRKSLKKTTTKEFEGSSEDDLNKIARVFEEMQGSYDVLAKHFGVELRLIVDNKPNDARDFAKKLLEGLYLADEDATARARFRENLQIELMRTSRKLRPSTTKEFEGVQEADVAAAAKLYKDNFGDLDILAKLCGISLEVLKERAPDSAEEFGTNLLLGHYSVDKTESSKAKVREMLKEQVEVAASLLKKTVIRRESMSEPLESQIDALAKMWDEKKSVEELAINVGLSADIIEEQPPTDGQDFARKTFAGVYTVVGRDRTMSVFRRGLKDQIEVQLQSLKSAVTSRPRSATEDDLESFGKFFTEQNGDIKGIAKALGIGEQVMAECPPTDAADFAQKLLDGLYSVDKGEQARQQHRSKMRKEIENARKALKKTSTKVWDGEADEEDIEAFAKFYTDNKGDLEALAKVLSLDAALLSEHKPKDATDFAKRLLSGGYTFEYVAVAAKAMRGEMVRNIKEHHMPKLRKSVTKETLGAAQPGDIAKVAKIYNDLKGDVKKLADAFSVSQANIAKAAVKDANEFAVKLLAGSFADAEKEDQRDKLRDVLNSGLKKRPSLRSATTKEALGEPKEEDIVEYAKIFDQECNGDLEEVSKRFNVNVAALKEDAPADGQKFAVKYLQGGYKS